MTISSEQYDSLIRTADRLWEAAWRLDEMRGDTEASEWVAAKVSVPSFAHPVRAGSRLQMSVSAPGRNHATWEFESPPYDSPPTIRLARGLSSLTLGVLATVDVPEAPPPCPSLRGQPCRVYEAIENVPAD